MKSRLFLRNKYLKSGWSKLIDVLHVSQNRTRRRLHLHQMYDTVVHGKERHAKASHLSAWTSVFNDQIAMSEKMQAAVNFWKRSILSKLVPFWAEKVHLRQQVKRWHKSKLSLALPFDRLNSSMQLSVMVMCDNKRRIDILKHSWSASFGVILQEVRAQNEKSDVIRRKLAIIMSWSKVLDAVNCWKQFHSRHERCQRNKQTSDEKRRQILKYKLFHGISNHIVLNRRSKQIQQMSDKHYRARYMRFIISLLIQQATRRRNIRARNSRMDRLYRRYRLAIPLRIIRCRIKSRKEFEQKKQKANRMMYMRVAKWSFCGWKAFLFFQKHKDEVAMDHYNMHLKVVTIKGMNINVNAEHALRQTRSTDGETQVISRAEEKLQRQTQHALEWKSATRIQSIFRRLQATKKADEWKTFRDWAVLRVQGSFRMKIARRKLRTRKRVVAVNIAGIELEEIDLMLQEDLAQKYFLYFESMASMVQRTFRGHRSRAKMSQIRRERFVEKAVKFKNDQVAVRKLALQHRIDAQARLEIESNAVTILQNCVRGWRCKRMVKEMILAKKKNDSAKRIQLAYRIYIARKLTNAKHRCAVLRSSYLQNRKFQGKLLKIMTLGQGQNAMKALAQVIARLGFMPITFHNDFSIIFSEILHDFAEFAGEAASIFYGIKAGFSGAMTKETKLFNIPMFQTEYARRINLMVQDKFLAKGDPVVIANPEDCYYGFTARIVCIDYKVSGNPLAEVRLDCNGLARYFRITRDPVLFFTTYQPLVKLEKLELQFMTRSKCDKIALLNRSLVLKESRRLYLAARVIQNSYRIHRSHRRCAKRRYEFWKKLSAAREVVLEYYKTCGAITRQSVWVSTFMRLCRKNYLQQNLVRLPDIPPSVFLSAVRAQHREELVEEFRNKQHQREKFVRTLPILPSTPDYMTRWNILTKPISASYVFSYEVLLAMKALSKTVNSRASTVSLPVVDSSKKYELDSKDDGGVLTVLSTAAAGDVKITHDKHNRSCWSGRWEFGQFVNSPHVRLSDGQVYHGEWMTVSSKAVGKPKTRYVPQGEGLILFMDAWGIASEEKVLIVTVHRAKNLIAADIDTSDPYVLLRCNRKELRSSTKWSTLFPIWEECYQLDVTDPSCLLEVVVMDFDLIGSNDFLGMVTIPIANLAREDIKGAWYKLRDDDAKTKNESGALKAQNAMAASSSNSKDRGEIMLSLRWTEFDTDEDQQKLKLKIVKAIMIQSWYRRLLAVRVVAEERSEHKVRMAGFLVMVIQIQCSYRCHRSRRILGDLRDEFDACVIVQAIVRRFLARRHFVKLLFKKEAVIVIQKWWRRYVSYKILFVLKKEKERFYFSMATKIQSIHRRNVALAVVEAMRLEDGSEGIKLPISDWFMFYGTDRKYGSKRLRRIVSKAFQRLIAKDGSKIWTKYGMVLNRVSSFSSDEENDDSEEGQIKSSMLHVQIPSYRAIIPLNKRKRKAIKASASLYDCTLRLDCVDIVKSVGYFALIIQCNVRAFRAISIFRVDIFRYRCAVKIQRRFRKFLRIKATCWSTMVRFFRSLFFRKMLLCKKFENECASIIQRCFRCYLSRNILSEMLVIRDIEVSSWSSFYEPFLPKNVTDGSIHTMWCAKGMKNHLTLDLKSPYNVNRVEFLCGISSLTPKFVSVSGMNENGETGVSIASDAFISISSSSSCLTSGKLSWSSVSVASSFIFRYLRLDFKETHQSPDEMCVRLIRVIRSRIKIMKIIAEPQNTIIQQSRYLGVVYSQEISCKALGWPMPSFQWTKDGNIVENGDQPILSAKLLCRESTQVRIFTCSHCGGISNRSPSNALHVICRNCLTIFKFSDAEEYEKKVALWIAELSSVDDGIVTIKRQIDKIQKNYDIWIGQQPINVRRRLRMSQLEYQKITKHEIIIKRLVTMRSYVEGRCRPVGYYSAKEYECMKDVDDTASVASATSGSDNSSVTSFVTGGKTDFDTISTGSSSSYRRGKFSRKKKGKLNLQKFLKAANEVNERKKLDKDQGHIFRKSLKSLGDELDSLLSRRSQLLREWIQSKPKLPGSYLHQNEGEYQCVVKQDCPGGVSIVRKSSVALIVVKFAENYPLRVERVYVPKMIERRKNWPKYSSIHGTFVDGTLVGNVTIRYACGSLYDGPYIHESQIRKDGVVQMSSRDENHWGVWVSPTQVVYEGDNVDNHFDDRNISGKFRVSYPSHDVYEGVIVDEARHGIGQMLYKDGSVYNGEWFLNKRCGYGVLWSFDGSMYEGSWDNDHPHGEGVYRWRDEGLYIGTTYYGERKGVGLFVSPHKDTYKGEFKGGQMCGRGVMVYANQSYYTGHFQNNARHGIGNYVDKDGTQYLGNFDNDERCGPIIVRSPRNGGKCDAIQIGEFVSDKMVKWLTMAIDPGAASQLSQMFGNKDEFDGILALILAKNLPAFPGGVSPLDPRVRKIIEKIRVESGELVGFEALQEAKKNIEGLVLEVNEKQSRKQEFEINSGTERDKLVECSRSLARLEKKFAVVHGNLVDAKSKMEQFWFDDATETRRKFSEIVTSMESSITKEQWIAMKNQHDPSPLLRDIMQAVCRLFGISSYDKWKSNTLLFADSELNALEGDSTALTAHYQVKLIHIGKKFDPIRRIGATTDMAYLHSLTMDAKFRPDNYFVISLGSVGPLCVRLVLVGYQYIKLAQKSVVLVQSMLQSEAEFARTVNQKEETIVARSNIMQNLKNYDDNCQSVDKEIIIVKEKLEKELSIAKYCEEAIEAYERSIQSKDRYGELERKLAKNVEKFQSHACIELMIQSVETRIETQEKLSKFQKVDKDRKAQDDVGGTIVEWIDEEVQKQRNVCRVDGFGDGGILEVLSSIVDSISCRINQALKYDQSCRKWSVNEHQAVESTFISTMALTKWHCVDVYEADMLVVAKWYDVFPETLLAARKALEACVNPFMSELAKYEASIWSKYNLDNISFMESIISSEFEARMVPRRDMEDGDDDEEKIPSKMSEYQLQTFAETCTDILDSPGNYSPEELCQAYCWSRQHRDHMKIVVDKKTKQLADEFSEGETNALELACCIRNDPQHPKYDKALAWSYYHIGEINEYETSQALKLSDEFAADNILNTATAAVTIINNVESSSEIIAKAMAWASLHARAMSDARKEFEVSEISNAEHWMIEADRFSSDCVSLKGVHQSELTPEQRTCIVNAHQYWSYLSTFYETKCQYYGNIVKSIAARDPRNQIAYNIRPSEASAFLKDSIVEFEGKIAAVSDKLEYFRLQAEKCRSPYQALPPLPPTIAPPASSKDKGKGQSDSHAKGSSGNSDDKAASKLKKTKAKLASIKTVKFSK